MSGGPKEEEPHSLDPVNPLRALAAAARPPPPLGGPVTLLLRPPASLLPRTTAAATVRVQWLYGRSGVHGRVPAPRSGGSAVQSLGGSAAGGAAGRDGVLLAAGVGVTPSPCSHLGLHHQVTVRERRYGEDC